MIIDWSFWPNYAIFREWKSTLALPSAHSHSRVPKSVRFPPANAHFAPSLTIACDAMNSPPVALSLPSDPFFRHLNPSPANGIQTHRIFFCQFFRLGPIDHSQFCRLFKVFGHQFSIQCRKWLCAGSADQRKNTSNDFHCLLRFRTLLPSVFFRCDGFAGCPLIFSIIILPSPCFCWGYYRKD